MIDERRPTMNRLLTKGLLPLLLLLGGCSSDNLLERTVYNTLRTIDCERYLQEVIARGESCNRSFDREFEAYRLARKALMAEETSRETH